MGKATILTSKGGGLYDVALNYDASAYNQRVAALTAGLASLDSQLTTLDVQIAAARAAKAAALAALDAAIIGKETAAIKAAEGLLLAATAELEGLAQTRADLTARRTASARGLETLQAAPPADRLVEAWCADYSEDLSGEVGTINPAGDDGVPLLHPGYTGQATYNPARDGHYRKREHMGPAELFFNAALVAGWQKWRPTIRIGTITAMDSTSCDVALTAVESTDQRLDVNQGATLTGVGFSYMECHGAAFAVGDVVAVAFTGQNWSAPQVIGFEKNPRPCTVSGFLLHNWLPGQLGYPTPWANNEILLKKGSAGFMAAEETELAAGNHDWQGYAGRLSWDGAPSRYWPVENAQFTSIFYPNDVPYAGDWYDWTPPPGTYRLLSGEVNDWVGRGVVFMHGKAITDWLGMRITSATLSPDRSKVMLTVLPGEERVYFFDLGTAPVPLAAMRLRATFATYAAAADFASLTAAELAANVAPYATPIWRFNASGTIGVSERFGTRQIMTIDWANETVSVAAGSVAQITTRYRKTMVVRTASGPYPNDDPEFPDYYVNSSQTLPLAVSVDKLFKLCDWQGDDLVEGELQVTQVQTFAWEVSTGGTWMASGNLDQVDSAALTIAGVVVASGSEALHTNSATLENPRSLARGASWQAYLHGLDLRAAAYAVDVLSFPPVSSEAFGESDLRTATVTNTTGLAGTVSSAQGSGIVNDSLRWYDFTGPLTIHTNYDDGPGASGTSVSETVSLSTARLQRDDIFAPHNGQGIGIGKIASLISYGPEPERERTVSLLAEIQRFPCLKTFTFSGGEMVRFAQNVDAGLIAQTPNWAQIAVL